MTISVEKSCGLCGCENELHRHHIDWDHSNNSTDNVIIICANCHAELHKIGFMSKVELLEVRKKVETRDPARFNAKHLNEPGQGSLF